MNTTNAIDGNAYMWMAKLKRLKQVRLGFRLQIDHMFCMLK